MVRYRHGQSFLIFSCLLLFSCTNFEIGNLPKPKSTPQLPLTQATAILPSPDGKWMAYFFTPPNFVGDYNLIVTDFDDTVIWNINQKTTGTESEFSPYRWSQDSRYLYFNIHAWSSGGVSFSQSVGLQRLDVTNGNISEILPRITVDFSLSPKDDKLAYINYTENGIQLILRDMNTNKEKNVLLGEYSNAGSIVWSPNQDYLVFATIVEKDSPNISGYVELLDVETLTSKTIAKNEDWFFDPLVWLNSHKILIRERGGDYFYLDIMTEELSPAPSLDRFPN